MYVMEWLIGLSSGLFIGAIFAAILTLLSIFPRIFTLIPTTNTPQKISIVLLCAVLLGTYLSFAQTSFHLPVILPIMIGFFHGVFNGMITSALLEIMDVFPKVMMTLRIKKYFVFCLYAILFGKIIGVIIQAIYFID